MTQRTTKNRYDVTSTRQPRRPAQQGNPQNRQIVTGGSPGETAASTNRSIRRISNAPTAWNGIPRQAGAPVHPYGSDRGKLPTAGRRRRGFRRSPSSEGPAPRHSRAAKSSLLFETRPSRPGPAHDRRRPG